MLRGEGVEQHKTGLARDALVVPLHGELDGTVICFAFSAGEGSAAQVLVRAEA
ncbi:hypothetical protein [Streptomyces sioyaensis]|uniref:hypothetical protein n=1 Tax=Streptomyces sioyaensis TaxID=67364 RepID=UPI003F54218C